VLRKPSRNSQEDARDVPADDPVGTMDRFAEGLRRVLAAEKPPPRKAVAVQKRRKVRRR
jgi:hypothetical protein